MKEGLELVMKLKPVRFTWGKEHGGKADFGFIAQELGEVLPEIVVYEPDGKYAKGLDYSKVTPVLTAAVQALKAANDNLTSHNPTAAGTQVGERQPSSGCAGHR